MWVRKSAIRPVPSFARIHAGIVEKVRQGLISEGLDSQAQLDQAYDDFESTQFVLAEYVGTVLNRPLGDAILALGYFLSLSIWMIFDSYQGSALRTIGKDELASTKQLFALDETLRESEPHEVLETDDVVAMEQPALVAFVHEHVQATLDAQGAHIDPEELRAIYRMLLIEILALSYAVDAPLGFPVTRIEASA